MRVWEMDKVDVLRFVLSRADWHILIEAIAGAAAWAPQDRRGKMWDALEVLRNAEEDIDASALMKALAKIAEYTKNLKGNDAQIIHAIASGALIQRDKSAEGGE